MASRSRPEELIQEALDGNCVPLGDYKARPDGDGWITRIPSVAADHADVDGETSFKKFLDPDTGAVVSIPVDELEDGRQGP